MKRGFLLPKAEQSAAAAASTAEESVIPQRKRKARPPPRVSADIKRQYPHLEHACGRPLLLLQASLGPSLFLTPSPAKARCLVIDCAHRNTRRMWEAVSLEVAYQWGMAARTLEKLVVRYPKPAVSRRKRSKAPVWSMGVWMAILEGHAHGRQRAVAVKNKTDKKGKGEMEAIGSGSSSQAASVAASDGSLRVLEFEAVDTEGPQEWERGDGGVAAPSSTPLLPKTDGGLPPRILPVHLPALTEVRNMPVDVAAWRMYRSWHSPGIRVLTFTTHPRSSCLKEYIGAEWVRGCTGLEALVCDDRVNGDGGLILAMLAELPADGKSLEGLRELGNIHLYGVEGDEIQQLQHALTLRGCKKKLAKLRIDTGTILRMESDVDSLTMLDHLVTAVVDPEALLTGGVEWAELREDDLDAELSVELLSWARAKSPFLKRHVEELARIVPRVTYHGLPEPHHPAATAMTPSTFPRADCFHLAAESLTRYTMQRVVSVAKAIGKTYIRVSGEEGEDAAPVGLAVEFLKALQTARLNEGSEAPLDVLHFVSLGGEDVGSLWETHAAEVSPIRCLELWITDTIPPGASDNERRAFIETVSKDLLAMLKASTRLGGHRETDVRFFSLHGDVREYFARHHLSDDFDETPYTFTFDGTSLSLRRRRRGV
ncbi:unnamed protein product [Vitrella brassicaformis CCMP3155]|uniref:Uncharacterized protein n=1 Tax=Vitrella brassicaformis (strain CCMP3155) TaxID=1169540 RepID=A0A0G4GJG4_VITBC|nr:unnamed protein product [Vitrella brassicaformis CCMP3155]|eukprot:CEM30091.1 unnamed protein product [Vitrella brassicaformis CCMP3155]